MTRTAIYVRSARDGPGRTQIEDQLQACADCAARSGWEVVGSYQDRGISGATLDRPGLRSLLDAIDAGRVDIVLSTDTARLSRDIDQHKDLLGRFRDHGVLFRTVEDQGLPLTL